MGQTTDSESAKIIEEFEGKPAGEKIKMESADLVGNNIIAILIIKLKSVIIQIVFVDGFRI